MALLDELWPIRCAGCDHLGGPVCVSCVPDLDAQSLGERCAPGRIAAAFRYEAVARSLLLGLKVRCLRPYADPLADAITEVLQRGSFAPDVVSWVPARPSARRQRGFDQAELLAERVARRAGLRCMPTLRAYERADQVGLGRTMRAVNASSAFEGVSGPSPGGAKLILIDDLITTGATARACTAALSACGWHEVATVTACRA